MVENNLGKDIERVGALVQGFYKYRDNIDKLLPIMAATSQRLAVSPEVMAAAWVGFSMARIWPEKERVAEGDMPLPETAILSDFTIEQQQFVAFAYGVLGGLCSERPLSNGPLGSIADLAVAFAPLVVIPAEAINDDGCVANTYLLEVAEALDLSLDQVHTLLAKLGMAQN